MKLKLVKEVIEMVQQFQEENAELNLYSNDINGFKNWCQKDTSTDDTPTPSWDGKEKGRSAESVINTLLVHLNKYAKYYSKSAIYGSEFSTQEDFIFLINLQAYGAMSKMDLIKLNKQEKPAGIKTINRLIKLNYVLQKPSNQDKRSKIISITPQGLEALHQQMDNIRKATQVVTGNLNEDEKIKLIHLLQKLDHFHQPIYDENIDTPELLDYAYNTYLKTKV